MADQIILSPCTSGAALYVHVRNSSGQVWDGSAFGAYSVGSWMTYSLALTEQGASMIYAGNFPALAEGKYTLSSYVRAGGTPAVGDQLIAISTVSWDGAAIVDALGVDATTIAAAVWSNATRTLTSLSGQVGDIAAAVWNYATRALTVFGFNVTSTLESRLTSNRATKLDYLDAATSSRSTFNPALNTVTVANTDDCKTDLFEVMTILEKLDDTLENGDTGYVFSADALGQGPTAEAPLTDHLNIIQAIVEGIDPPGVEVIAQAVMASVVDGTLTIESAIKRIVALTSGKAVCTSTDPLILSFYNEAEDAVVCSLSFSAENGERNRL